MNLLYLNISEQSKLRSTTFIHLQTKQNTTQFRIAKDAMLEFDTVLIFL